MAFEPVLESKEEVLEDIQIDFNKDAGLRLVLTNKGAFWPGTKSFAVSDPITTEHLSLSKIELFSYRAKSKLVSVGTGGLLVLLGLFMTFGEYFETGAILVGLPQALLVAGIVIALMGGRRKRLVLRGPSAKLKWSAPIVFGKKANQELDALEGRLRGWAERVGVRLEE